MDEFGHQTIKSREKVFSPQEKQFFRTKLFYTRSIMIRKIFFLGLLTVIWGSLYGGEITPLPVKNASFEGSGDYAQTVKLTNKDGSNATIKLDNGLSATGSQSLCIAKTNALGRAIVTWEETFPVKPQQEYEISLGVHVREATYGGILTLEGIELDSAGADVGAHTPGFDQIPVFNRKNEFLRRKVHFITGKNTDRLRINFIISGNPLEVNLDDLSVTKGADNAYYSGIHKPADPIPARNAILRKLENIKPREARIEKRNDKPTLIVDGQPIPPIIYRGGAHFGSFAKAGVHLYATSMFKGGDLFWDKNDQNAQMYRGNGKFDFYRLENELFRIANADPKAMVILTVTVDPDPAWCDAHPDSIFQTIDGQKGIIVKGSLNVGRLVRDLGQKKPEEWWAHSYASLEYQDYVCEALKKLSRFLKESPAGKIVIGFTVCGGNDGQYLPWIDGEKIDYSPASTKAFRTWLREEYKDDKTLQKAWSNSAVTLDTATLASPSEILSPMLLSSRPGNDCRVLNTKKFSSIAVALMIRRFMGTLKQEMGRPIIGNTYYSDVMYPHINRLAVNELLGGPEVDMITTVATYAPWRRSGSTGMSSNFCVASAVLRNKLHITELDYRTWLSEGAEVDNSLSMGRDAEDFKAQIRRDAGIALARGGGIWFYDMCGSWYEDPSLMKTIAESAKMAEWATKSPRQPKPQAAIFLDERSPLHLPNLMSVFWDYLLGQSAVNASGVQFDIYLLDDITRKDLPDYKLYVVLSPMTLSRLQADAFMNKARQPGKVLLVEGRAAIASSDYSGPENLQLLLGMQIKKGNGNVRQVVMRDETAEHPLAEKVHGIIGREDVIYRGWAAMPITSWYYVDDSTAVVLGRWQGSNKPGLAVKITEQGTVIYSAAEGGYTPQLLNNAARLAGILPESEAGNASYVGYGVAVSHRMCNNPVKINFGQTMRFFTPDLKDAGEGTSWSPCVEECQTGLILYEEKAGDGKKMTLEAR